MNTVCKVCGATVRADGKFCGNCGVPFSLIERAGSKIVDSETEMTVIAGSDNDEVPTVDAPARPRPSVPASPVVNQPLVNQPTVNQPVVNRPIVNPTAVNPLPVSQRINYPLANTQQIVATPIVKTQRARHILLSKPARTILFVFIFAALPLFIPQLADKLSSKDQAYREMLPDPHELVTFKSSGSADTSIPGSGGSQTTAETTVSSTGVDQPVIVGSEHPIEDPTNSLDSFYASLARTDSKQPGSITRVTHYGDSPITNDGITSTVRRLLQEQFGDGGHGFILMDKPWAWYGHQGITFSSGGGWDDNPMGPGSSTGDFGLGGVSFTATGAGKYARFAPASTGDTGKNFSRMDVYFLREPNGGQFAVSVNGENTQTVSTAGDADTSGFYEIKAQQPGANTFEVKTVSGTVRLFGAVIENEGPGVVYDSLGVNGAYAGLLVAAMNESHWVEQLKHRNPNLVIINYGTNESEYASASQMQKYEKDLHEVIRRVREALPGVAILVLSPMDRGKHAPGGKVITNPAIPMIVEMQRRVAMDEHVAFFNTFQAMGGEGTMAKWAAGTGKNHLVGGDLTHPTAEGAEIVGRLIYEAINDGYTKYKARADKPLVAKGK